jgi:hypothetical protein
MRAPDLSHLSWPFFGHEHWHAVQMFGGNGVRTGMKVEALYRESRALRVYEGASEVQKVIIAREMLRARETNFQQAAE